MHMHIDCLLPVGEGECEGDDKLAIDPFLGLLLLIAAGDRARCHQRCCCRGGGSHWMDISLLRGRASEASLTKSHTTP